MSVEENKTLVSRFFDETLNRRNLAVLDELVAADVVIHTPVPGVEGGRASFRQLLDVFFAAFPVQRVEVHDLIAEGDRVVVRHTHHATHSGEFMGLPPTGKEVAVTGIDAFRIADGRIAEFWHQDDLLGLMQQLGAIPALGQTAA